MTAFQPNAEVTAWDDLGGQRRPLDSEAWDTLSPEAQKIIDPRRKARQKAIADIGIQFGLSGHEPRSPEDAASLAAIIDGYRNKTLSGMVNSPEEVARREAAAPPPYDKEATLAQVREDWPEPDDPHPEIEAAHEEGRLF